MAENCKFTHPTEPLFLQQYGLGKMSLTIQQIILDAKRLASRLKEHDNAADVLLSQTQSVYKQLDAMKQYQEDVSDLNDVARQRPHAALVAGIQQENQHLRKLQLENRELRAALEDHQNALEHIMSKYRQQTDTLIQQNRIDLPKLFNCADIERKLHDQSHKIAEMAAVMNRVALMDEESSINDFELIAQLITENRGLRELLQISRGSYCTFQQRDQEDEARKRPTHCEDVSSLAWSEEELVPQNKGLHKVFEMTDVYDSSHEVNDQEEMTGIRQVKCNDVTNSCSVQDKSEEQVPITQGT